MNHKFAFGLLVMLFLANTHSLISQSPNVDLRFVIDSSLSCTSEQITYEVQVKTQEPGTHKFYGINLRFFLDGNNLEFNDVQCALNPFYNCTLSGTEMNFDFDLGLESPTYFNMVISGQFMDFLLADVSDSWLTVAELIFDPVSNVLNSDSYCESIVWDLKQDQTTSLTGYNEGVVVVFFDNYTIISVTEFPQNENWIFTANNAGIPEASNCSEILCPTSTQILVTNCHDTGEGSLRHALDLATHNDTVRFSESMHGDTIILTSEPLKIMKDMVIAPQEEMSIHIKTEVECIFEIMDCSVEMHNLEMIGGSNHIGSTIVNNGMLNLENINFYTSSDQNSDTPFILNKGTININGFVALGLH